MVIIAWSDCGCDCGCACAGGRVGPDLPAAAARPGQAADGQGGAETPLAPQACREWLAAPLATALKPAAQTELTVPFSRLPPLLCRDRAC